MKKFKLDRKNAMISGVCSGVANYFDIDVTLIRILTAIFFSTTWFIYLITALVTEYDETAE